VLSANAHWAHGVVPAFDHYLEQCEHDSAVHTCMVLVELASGLSIPDDVHATAPLPTMRRLCARALAYANDLMSYEKEVLLRGNFDWSLATGRYRTARSPFPELRLPG
jgi:Terpene synthase family 2, C-terminal metal binding